MTFKVPTSNENTSTPKLDKSESLSRLNDLTSSKPETAVKNTVDEVGNTLTNFNDTIEQTAAKMNIQRQPPVDGVSQFNDTLEQTANTLHKQDPFYNVKLLARDEDPVMINNIFKLSDETGKSPDKIKQMLVDTPADEIVANEEVKNIDKHYPGLRMWMRDPVNYNLFKKDPRYIKSVEEDVNAIEAFTSDASRVVKQNYYTLQQMGLHAGMISGTIPLDEGAALMSDLQEKIDADPFLKHKQQNKDIQASYKRLQGSLDLAEKEINKSFNDFEKDKLFKSLYGMARGMGYGVEGSMDMALTLIQNPATAVLWGAQSLNSAVPPMITGFVGAKTGTEVGAAIGGVAAGPIGAIVGGATGFSAGSFIGGASGGYATAYTQYLLQEADKFRDPETGKVDFKRMYSDPRVIKNLKKMANRYASVQAAFEGIGSYLIGKRVARVSEAIKAAPGKSVAKRVAKGVAATGVEMASDAALEMAGETSSQLAAGATPKEAFEQGIIEGLMSPVSTATHMTGAAIVNRAFNIGNIQDVKRLSEYRNKAVSAIESINIVKKMREDKSSTTVAEAKQQINQLINTIKEETKKEETKKPTETNVIDTSKDEDSIIGAMAENEKNSSDTNKSEPTHVSVTIEDFERYALSKDITASQLADKLGKSAVENYMFAKQNGGTFFNINIGEYYLNSDDYADLDEIVRVNGNELNALEANEFNDLLSKAVDEEDARGLPTSKMESDITTDEAQMEGFNFNWEEGSPEEGDPVFRPIKLMQAGRSEAEKKIYRSIRKAIETSMEKSGQPIEVGDAMAEIQFRHIRLRSELLGKRIEDVAKETAIGHKANMVQKDRAAGMFMPRWENSVPRSKILFSNSTKAHVVVHEFAHSWLFNMSEDYDYIKGIENKTEAQQAYYEAMTTTAKLLGIDNVGLINKGLLPNHQYIKIHETFAQTAEKYMLEGDFKTSKLEKIFEGMRKWMVKVADVVGLAYKHFPPLKMSPEVHRVFQTILDGDARVNEEMTDMFPPPLFDPNLLGKDKERYTNAINEARQSAIGQMYANIFNKSYKEREDAIAKALRDFTTEAELDIDSRPSMVLRDYIKTSGERAKITYESVMEVLAGNDQAKMDEIKALSEKGIIAPQKRAGVDVREIMTNWGISNPQDMIDMLAEMANRDQLVEDRLNQIIDERFPILKNDDQIHEEAVNAIQNKGREKIIELEMEKLAEQYLKTMQAMNKFIAMPPNMVASKFRDTVKASASALVKNAKAFNLNPNNFLKESMRLSKNAATFLVKGDYEAAFYEKQGELINFMAFRMAREQRHKVDATAALIKRLNSISNQDAGKRYDVDLLGYAKIAISMFNSSRQIPLLNDSSFVNKLPDGFIQMINTHVDTFNALTIEGDNTNITSEHFLYFGAILKTLQQMAIKQRGIELATIKGNRDQVVMSIASSFGGRKPSDPTTRMGSGLVGVVDSESIDAETLFSSLYKTEKEWIDSDIYKIFQEVKNAEATYQKESEIDGQNIYDAVKKFAASRPDLKPILDPIMKRIKYLRFGEVGKPIFASELNHTFANEGELLQMLLYLGSDTGREKLVFGGFYDVNKKKTMVDGYYDILTKELITPKLDKQLAVWMEDGTITKEHMDLLQVIWDAYERHYDSVKASIRATRGYDIGKVQPRTISTKWGEYKGGYVPLSRDINDIDVQRNQYDFTVDSSGTYVNELFPSADMSLTNKRTSAYYPLSLDFGKLMYTFDNVYRIAYMMPTMFEVGKVMSDVKFQEALETRRPGSLTAVIKPWFQRTMGQEYSERSATPGMQAMDRAVRVFRNNVRIKYFMFGVRSAIKQYLGILPAAVKISPSHLIRSAWEVGVSPRKRANDIAQLSTRMGHRFNYNAKNVVKSYRDFDLTFDYISKSKDAVTKATYFLIQTAQTHVDAIVFTAAFNQATKELDMTSEQAISYASDAVERTQSTSNISARANIQHGTEKKRLITDFMTIPITMHRLEYEARMRNADEPTIKRLQNEVKVLLYVAAIPSVVGALLSSAGRGLGASGEDEEEKYMNSIATSTLTEVLDVRLPFSGRALEAVMERDVTPLIPASREIKTFTKAGSGLSNITTKGDISGKEMLALLDAFTEVTGVPASVVSSMFRTVIEFDEDLKREMNREDRRLNRKR